MIRKTYDYIIIGGGIVGTSTAWQLQKRRPDRKILIIEKEEQFARHQTGHNSGVIHAGVYYRPGSLKARFCKRGVVDTINFCRQQGIPYDRCGKLLVATNADELERMDALYRRCRENGIVSELLDKEQLTEREPAVTGSGAIFVQDSGIVDYTKVCMAMAHCFQALGGDVALGTRVRDIRENDRCVSLVTSRGSYSTKYLISCAGLMADRLAKLHGIDVDFQIIPFRGEYYRLPSHRNGLIRHLIYPIPDPRLPFLGVHLTRMIDGSITVGPNAVLGWKREGYGRFNLDLRDAGEMIFFPGFRKVLAANFGNVLHEMKNSVWKRGYLNLVQKYCPQLGLHDLLPHPAGIRSQAVLSDGTLVHDFLFAESPRSLHVCNAPSPAATSAIPIGHYICDRIQGKHHEAIS